jgi:hypothetical protein
MHPSPLKFFFHWQDPFLPPTNKHFGEIHDGKMFCNRLGNFDQGSSNFCHHPKIFHPIMPMHYTGCLKKNATKIQQAVVHHKLN